MCLWHLTSSPPNVDESDHERMRSETSSDPLYVKPTDSSNLSILKGKLNILILSATIKSFYYVQ